MTADPRVARLRSLDTEATPGPWYSGDEAIVFDDSDTPIPSDEADADLIAGMRNTWPAMITLLEGVLGRHRTSRIWPDICFRCQVEWPCADIAAALAVLDTLDPP
jgi:hypothetical protein